jgi:hypothetical protein
MEKTVHVHILTYCKDISLLYGSELIFKTLRVGFPNADITVTDNASIPVAGDRIETLAKENDCRFQKIPGTSIDHHDFIQDTIRNYAYNNSLNASVVFLDPDICLWNSCEDFTFDGLIAGRLVGGFHDSVTQTLTAPRLHTSFLWIPDARRLQDEIGKMRIRHFDFDPFRPFSFRMKNTWYRYDTGASLYSAIHDKISAFTEMHMAQYDHIFSGSHISKLIPLYSDEVKELMIEVHSLAKNGDLNSLKGIHKHIDEIWWNIHENTVI